MKDLLTTLKPWIVAAAVVTLAGVFFYPAASALVRKWRGAARGSRVVFLLAVIFATLYGGAKHGHITFPRTDPEAWYLIDAGSAVSNDCVVVKMVKSPVVPLSANIFLDALQVDYTNDADWASHSFNVYSNTLAGSGLAFTVPFAAATNYNFQAYTDWTPAPTVRTNGVALVFWRVVEGKATNCIAMVRTGVYTNDVRLAPNPAITNHTTVSVPLTLSGDADEE